MALQDGQGEPQSSTCGLDFLYCHEEILVDLRMTKSKLEEEEEDGLESTISSPSSSPSLSSLSPSSYSSSFDDDDYDELVNLISKEESELRCRDQTPLAVLESFRKESVEWMVMVNAHLGFSPSTLVLAVNYFDRFIFASSRIASFHKIPAVDDQHCTSSMPWITQLVSVACLSLASKVQETHVPILLDFQINCKYVFQPKTVMKMELLVMSTLEWKMNPVTPFSYFEHLTRRLRFKTFWQQEIICTCENLLLSLIADPGYLSYPPSVIAASVVLHAMGELEFWSPMESEIFLIGAFKISKEKVEDCSKLISELSSKNQSCKRRRICSSSLQR